MTVAHAAAFVNALEDASHQGTGCLYVADDDATRSGRVYFRDGKVYAVHVDGFMPQVGQRLRTGGMLSEEHYDALLAETHGNTYAANIGPMAVERGYITQDVLDAVSREILLSSIGAMFAWSQPKAKFKKNATTDQFNIPPVSVSAIVKAVTKRRDRWDELWNDIAPNTTPESTYPVLSDSFDPHSEPLSSEVAAVIAASTGAATLDTVAGVCGLTRFETGHILAHLVNNGVLSMSDAPTSHDNTNDSVHGTAEVAVSNGEFDDMGGDTAEPVGDSDDSAHTPHVVAPVHEVVAVESTDYGHNEQPTPHFAPDVIETVTHVSEDDAEQDEPSAFGGVEDSFPDGMDLGTIPTSQIEFDADDPAPTSDTPPLTGLSAVHDEQNQAEQGHDTPAPVEVPYVDAPYQEVGFTTTPAPLPADLPHFAEPVPPVSAPEPEAEPVNEIPPAPADAPVFVDASELDKRAADAPVVEGMPGVPLPPLPEFLPAPVDEVAPVPAPVDADEPAVAYVPEYDPEAEHEDVAPDYDPETATDEPVYAEEVYDLSAPVETPEHDATGSDAYAPLADASNGDEAGGYSEADDPRAAQARQRLLDEISAATEVATAAESTLARIEADHESHVAAAEQIQVTLNRYEQFLAEAAEDQSRLSEEASTVEQERLDAEAEHAEVEESAAAVAVEVEKAASKVDDATSGVDKAREALRKAEEVLTDAEGELTQAREAEAVTAEKSQALAAKFDELDRRASVVAADLSEAADRVESYTSEVEDVRQMAQSVESSRDNAAALKEAAEQRLASAQRNLSTKQERLAQLG